VSAVLRDGDSEATELHDGHSKRLGMFGWLGMVNGESRMTAARLMPNGRLKCGSSLYSLRSGLAGRPPEPFVRLKNAQQIKQAIVLEAVTTICENQQLFSYLPTHGVLYTYRNEKTSQYYVGAIGIHGSNGISAVQQ